MIKVEDVYPITVRTMPDGYKQEFITDKDLEDFTIPAKLDSLYDFLNGQTRYIEGIYSHDVERWLNNKPNLD